MEDNLFQDLESQDDVSHPLLESEGGTERKKSSNLIQQTALLCSILLVLFIILPLLILAIVLCKSTNSRFILLARNPQTVVLIVSIDGLRRDYLEKFKYFNFTNLESFIKDGVSVESMKSVFPTMTYPNHMSISTGLYAESHGILNNRMYDEKFNATYFYETPEEFKGRWYDGEPFWVTAEKQRVKTAIHAWAGSGADIKGVRPTFRKPYTSTTAADKENVDWILSFFDSKPPKARLLALYFEGVDMKGHSDGPDSVTVGEELKRIDDLIGYMLKGIKDRGHNIDIIILSDHGMAPVSQDKVIYLDDVVPNLLNLVQLYDRGPESAYGTTAAFQPRNKDYVQEIYQLLKNSGKQMDVYLKHEIPDQWHYKNHYRIPDILAVARIGWVIGFRGLGQQMTSKGVHGYDPLLNEMKGVFFANGPSFKKGYKHNKEIENIEIYNLVCHLLKITPSPNNGTFENVKPLLK